jgi:glycosyltransferase involved in cell wall biosynthesis
MPEVYGKLLCPRCSIVMSTRDKADYLDRTLASIYRQQVPFPFEVIVVDDGSTDGTRLVCNRYPVVYQYLQNPRYRNPSAARNTGYRLAQGDVVICQSDDIIHQELNTIETLVNDLRLGEFLLAKVENWQYIDGIPNRKIMEYCGPNARRPYFFLGALWREDLYAVGGCDEEFVEPCYDDNWFADCLMRGRKLQVRYTDSVSGRHQEHGHTNDTHRREYLSKELYQHKVREGNFCSSGGPWEYKLGLVQYAKRLAPEAVNEGAIPKTMAFFWASPTMSWMRYLTLASFRRYHPDWRMVLYTMPSTGGKTWASDEQLSDLVPTKNYTARLTELGVEIVDWVPPVQGLAPAHASDLCGWDYLWQQGGFFSDMDILWVDRLSYDDLCKADGVFCLSGGYMAIGFLASKKGVPLFRAIAAEARLNYSPLRYQNTGAEAVYRLAGVGSNWGQMKRPGEECLNSFRKKWPASNFLALPDYVIYPFTYQQIDAIFQQKRDIPTGCRGIHWFGGSPISQEWNKVIVAAKANDPVSTFTANIAKGLQ